MSSPDYKSLKKLADACRKAGIKHFKNTEFEFTLSDTGPISSYKRKTQESQKAPENGAFSIQEDISKQDQLSEEQLLFWSAGEMGEDEITKLPGEI